MQLGGIQLLLVEDNPGDSRLVREMLRGVSDITLAEVDRLAAAERHLASGEVDVVLLDLGLPDSQGLDTLAQVVAHHPALPVIVFTGLDDEDIALEAVKTGSQDFLVKGRFDAFSLRRAIRYALERQRAETALRESEERYRTLFNEMPVGVYQTGEGGRILDANPALAALLGYASPGELTGLVAGDFYVEPEDRARWRQAIEQEGVLHDAESHLRRRDGTLIWARDSGRVVRDKSGRVTSFEGTLSDITHRKQAELELRESEARFRAVILSANDAIISADGAGDIVGWNPGAERIFGYTETEVRGRPLMLLLPDHHHGGHLAGVSRIQTGGEPGIIGKTLEGGGRRKDGSEFPLEMSLSDWQIGDEKFYTATIRDITERKQAEGKLAASEAELRALFAAMTDVVIVYDADGRYLKIAPTNLASFYRPLDDMLGKTVHEILPKEQADYIFAKIGEALLTDKVVHGEYALQVDGKEVWFGSSASRIAENTIMWVAHDITNRKQAEERIQRQVETLGVLYKLSRTLSAMDDFNAILDLVTRHAAESAHVTFACVLLLEQDDLVLRAAFPVRLLDQDLQMGQRAPLAAHPLLQRVLEENAPRVLQIDSLEGSECAPFYLGVLQSMCIVPLYVRDRPFGLLMLCETRAGTREPFTAEKLRMASSIGDQAVSSLQRALLHEETVRQLGQLKAMHHIDQAIAGSMDMRLTLNVVLEHVTSQLKVDAASVLLLDPNSHTLECVAGRGFRTGIPKDIHLRLGEGYAGRAALEREPTHIPDLRLRGTDILRSPLVLAEGFVSYHCVPLIAKGQVKGVLEVFHRTRREDDEAWVNYMETLAGQAAIAIDNAQLFENLERSNVGLMLAYDATIEGWSRALDMRDKETEGHTQRVTDMTLHMARRSGFGEEELVHIRRGALLHDMGKLGVPDGILLKPGELTEAEWVLMRKHPAFAYEMLSPITYLHPALDIPYCHHEKWDGSGYPRGLKGEQIPMAARIFALVDVFDALRSDRPYRPAWPLAKALDHIRSLSGSHFDPDLVEPFLADVIAG